MKKSPLAVIVICFIAGFTTLIYEITWTRILNLVTGSTITAIAVVVAVFMAGLGFGGLIFGRAVDKTRHAFRLFASIQSGIVFFGLSSALLWQPLPGLYSKFYGVFDQSLSVIGILLFSSSLMFVPCFFMGGVLPVLAKAYVRDDNVVASGIGRLYAVNTIGSVIGALLTGFFLIAHIGQTGTLLVAVALNLILALYAFWSSSQQTAKSAPTSEQLSPDSLRIQHLVLIVAGVSGLCALAYEVLWTRVLATFLANSTYNFTLILVVLLIGLAVGSAVFAWFLKHRVSFSILAFCQGLIGLYILVTVVYVNDLPGLLFSCAPLLHSGILRIILPTTLLSFALAFVPTFLMGISFPLLCALYARRMSHIGTRTGKIIFANTCGAVVGSCIAGFILIPYVGITTSMILVAGVNVLLGMLVVFARAQSSRALKMSYSLVLLCAILVSISTVRTRVVLPPSLFRTSQRSDTLLYYKETRDGTVIVSMDKLTSIRACYINNSAVCGTTYDALKVVKMLGHLPFLFKPDAHTVLIAGFGIGITASAVAQHDVETMDCVEICPGVRDAAQYFEYYNNRILYDSRVNFIAADARTHLLTTSSQYDIISCDPTHPTLGCNNLYTKEYYELCRQHLNPGGIVCQYLPLHRLSSEEFRTLIKTFASQFTYCSVWLGYTHGILLASEYPLDLEFSVIQDALSAIDDRLLNDPYLLSVSLILDNHAIATLTKNVPINTDNKPYLEFFSGQSLEQSNWQNNLYMLIKQRIRPEILIHNIPDMAQLERYCAGQRYLLSGLIFKDQGNYRKMIDAFVNAAHINPENSEIQYILESELQQLESTIFSIDK